jgi:Mannosyl-glycoprotein endo-beta-N-acetylglucosaminidase
MIRGIGSTACGEGKENEMISAEVIAAAQAAQRKWGVWASVSLAQFGVESSWGRAMPPGSNNPFGIKAVAGQASVVCRTREVINGRSVYVNAAFAKYANFAEAFDAHGKLLATHPQYYGQAMKYAWGKPGGNAEDFIRGLSRFASDPNYVATLLTVARNNHLYQYDTLPGATVPAPSSPSVPVPSDVPLPVADWVIWVLNNLFAGYTSTFVGTLSLIYGWFIYAHIPISNVPISGDWKPWVALGLTLVFGVGGKAMAPTSGPVSLPPPQPQESNMDPVLIGKFIMVFEALVPVLEKIVEDKTTVATPAAPTASPDLISRIDELLAKLNTLVPSVTK